MFLNYQTPDRKPLVQQIIRRTIESLLALLILGVIFLCFFAPQSRSHPAKIPAAHNDLSRLRTALDMFAADTGRYPTPTEGLAALITNPNLPRWNGPYLRKIPNDPWGNPYIYTPRAPALSSAGQDGTPNTPDDITDP